VRAAAVLALLCAAGCATSSGPVPVSKPAGDLAWADVVAEHTREDDAWHYAVRQADLRATLVTPRLRGSFAAHRGEFQGKPATEFEELLLLAEPPKDLRKDELPEAEQPEAQVIVFACLYVTDLVNRDIAAGYSEWETTLSRGKASVTPVKIKNLRNTPGIKELLPHADRFDEIWVIRFPLNDPESGASLLAPGGEPLKLRLASAMADVSVEWSLTGTE
jgi:hypothetical protein